MKIIAHRGLINGPDADLENDPVHIQQLMHAGWHVETDVRHEHNTWYLGHDHAQHKVDLEFLLQSNLWIHVKDVTSAHILAHIWKESKRLNFFWHESDARVLTSQGYWWTQPGHELTHMSVAVLPELHMTDITVGLPPCYGVCTDWGHKLK